MPNSASTALARHLYYLDEKRISRPSEMADTAGIGGSAGAAYAFRGVVWFSRISTWCPVGKVLNCLKTEGHVLFTRWPAVV